MRRGRPPPGAASYSDMVISYMLAQFWHERNRSRNRCKSSESKAYYALAAAWKQLQTVLNHFWFIAGTLVHWCVDENCCRGANGNGWDLEACFLKVIAAIRRVIFRRLPTVPASNKWTVLGPCVDWFIGGVMCHNMLPLIYAASFGKLSEKCLLKAQSMHFERGKVSADFYQDVNWHAIAGSRMKTGLRLLQDCLCAFME